VEEWIASISPEIDVHTLSCDSHGALESLHLSIWIEPELQVRMTGHSAGYMPKPMAYNGWKRVLSHRLKSVLREVCPGLKRIPDRVRATMWFYVSNLHRWHMGDLNNYVKATEDMLNQCGHTYKPDELVRWPDMTDPFPVWIDDRKVRRNGEQGVTWVERNPRIEIKVEAIVLPGPVAGDKGRKKTFL
jgi:Holliday junction resolvase RusA-like endonuclease